MNRTLIAVLSVGALVLAAPSFAARDIQAQQQSASSPSPGVSGGAPEPLALPQSAAPATEMAMTGQVVLSTPDELVLHTASGMQKFVLTPDTKMLAGAAEGETVTVFYKGEAAGARATVITTGAKAGQSDAQSAKLTTSTATPDQPPMAMAMNESPEPAVSEPTATTNDQNDQQGTSSASAMSQTEKPAASSETEKSGTAMPRTTHLPKTASNLPLIGVTGLLALAGAVFLRALRT